MSDDLRKHLKLAAKWYRNTLTGKEKWPRLTKADQKLVDDLLMACEDWMVRMNEATYEE